MPAKKALLSALCLACLVTAAPAPARVAIGTAFSLEDERVLYVERRVEHWRDGELVAATSD